ncbi:MAG: EamA family transporter [Thalassobius sp.]|nr:EamA family transporter [Thalassovita sp.]
MNTENTTAQWVIILAFAAIYIIWGTTYLAILIGLEDFPPFLMASFRFIIAAFFLLGWSFYKGERKITFSALKKNFIVGIIVLAGGQGLLIWSEQHIASGYAAVLGATLPVWFVLIDVDHWKSCFSNKFIILGLVLGFVGIVFLFKDQLDIPLVTEEQNNGIIASIAVLLGCMCWVAGTLYYKYKPAPGSISFNLGWQLVCGSVFCFSVSLLTGELSGFSLASVNMKAWFAVSYLAVAGSVIAFIAYSWLLTKKPAAIVGTYAYVNPVIAVILGWILVNEIISTDQLSGMVLIIISAMLINFSKSKLFAKRKKVAAR